MDYNLSTAVKLTKEIVEMYDKKILSVSKFSQQSSRGIDKFWQELTNQRILANAILCEYQNNKFRSVMRGFNYIVPLLEQVHTDLCQEFWSARNESILAKVHSHQYGEFYKILSDRYNPSEHYQIDQNDGLKEATFHVALLNYATRLDASNLMMDKD